MQNYQAPQAPTSPSPKDMLLHALSMVTRPGSMALDMARDTRKAQEESLKNFGKGDKLNDLDFISNFITPVGMAGTTAKAFNSVARNPGSKDFLDNLYSRLVAAITSGPNKGQGQQWLKHLEKGAAKGEVDHTGLTDFLTANKDRVFTKDEIYELSQKNPVRLKETVYENGGGMYGSFWPLNPEGIKANPTTYREIVLQGNLPFDERLAGKSEEARRAAIEALSRNKAETESLSNLRDQANDTGSLHVYDIDKLNTEIQELIARRPALWADFDKARPLSERAKHFESDVTNQIGHLRTMLGERKGKISQILGEFQSDAHQDARKLGRLGKAGEKLPSEVERLYERFKKVDDELAAHTKAINAGDPNVTTEKDYQLRKKWSEAEAAWKDYSQGKGGVLPLPFQGDKEWAELLLKRALFEAAQNNADEIIIPSGQALTDAVGMPIGGQKMYNKDGPNQLMEYIKKQLGVEVQPEQIMKTKYAPLPSYSGELYSVNGNASTPGATNPRGPIPLGYDDTLRDLNGWGSIHSPTLTTVQRMKDKEPDPVWNALLADLTAIAPPPTTELGGTAIPFPAEARDKVLSDGQRLWSALGLAGIPTLDAMTQPKKKEKKKEKKK
jgi:hypothetical protein